MDLHIHRLKTFAHPKTFSESKSKKPMGQNHQNKGHTKDIRRKFAENTEMQQGINGHKRFLQLDFLCVGLCVTVNHREVPLQLPTTWLPLQLHLPPTYRHMQTKRIDEQNPSQTLSLPRSSPTPLLWQLPTGTIGLGPRGRLAARPVTAPITVCGRQRGTHRMRCVISPSQNSLSVNLISKEDGFLQRERAECLVEQKCCFCSSLGVLCMTGVRRY